MWPTRRGFEDSGVLGLAPHLGSKHTSNPWRPFIAPPISQPRKTIDVEQWMLGCHNLFIQEMFEIQRLKPWQVWNRTTTIGFGGGSHASPNGIQVRSKRTKGFDFNVVTFLLLTTTNHLFNHLISRCHHGRVDAWNHVNFDGQEDIWDHRLAALTNHHPKRALTRYSG